ncbi:cold-shock protein [Zhongshania marina]|uniref:Cold shock domain-containing protein n=1 Tax=Zhongshania marina TaxID=2304603 RepID=A0ABX9W0M9_9GAMM|nr:cold shock domain-containing protein [Zhongshania marina]
MPRGQVKSFSAQKGYGFIADSNESYFFHVKDLPKDLNPDEVKRGVMFGFDDVPGPKGMQAKRLVKIEQATVLQPCTDHIVRRESTPKHGEIILRISAKSPFYKDPQECRDALINGAKRAGCNAVLSLTVKRQTWSRGNYRHTMHWADGDLCLVAEPQPCKASDKAMLTAKLEQSVAEIEKSTKALVDKYNSKRFWQKFPWGLIIFMFIVVGFVVVSS